MRTIVGTKPGLTVHVFRSSLGDCSNNGISAGADSLLVWGATLEGYITLDDAVKDPYISYPRAVLVPGNLPGLAKIVPWGAFLHKRHTMFGGNFAYTSDSRFSRAIEAITGAPFSGAVPIHDRIEG